MNKKVVLLGLFLLSACDHDHDYERWDEHGRRYTEHREGSGSEHHGVEHGNDGGKSD